MATFQFPKTMYVRFHPAEGNERAWYEVLDDIAEVEDGALVARYDRAEAGSVRVDVTFVPGKPARSSR